MFIGTQGKRVRLVRSLYDATSKKSKQEQVGSFPLTATECPPEILEKLTDEEKAQLADWMASKAQAEKQQEAKMNARLLPIFISRVTEAVEQQVAELSPDVASAIIEAQERLAKAMKKAGYTKAKPAEEKPAKPAKTGAGSGKGKAQEAKP